MPSRVFQFFITSEELRSRLDEVRHKEHLYLMTETFFVEAPVEVIFPDQPFAPERFPDRVFLSKSMPLLQEGSHTEVHGLAYSEGWTALLFGHCEDGVLYMSDLSFKSSDKEARHLFQLVRRGIKSNLMAGVVLSGPSGGSGRLCKDLYYSVEAKECIKHGALWKQRGVLNSWFKPA